MPSDPAYECPKDGCDRVLPGSRMSNHYISAHKEAYPGLGDQEPVRHGGERADEPAASTDGGGSDNPLVSAGTDTGATADDDGDGADSGGPDDGCPDCGGELVDYRRYDTGEIHTIQGTSHYVRGDYRCVDCERWWVDE